MTIQEPIDRLIDELPYQEDAARLRRSQALYERDWASAQGEDLRPAQGVIGWGAACLVGALLVVTWFLASSR